MSRAKAATVTAQMNADARGSPASNRNVVLQGIHYLEDSDCCATVCSSRVHSFGPIFNLNLAFTSHRKAALIELLEAQIERENGERHVFQMAGMNDSQKRTHSTVAPSLFESLRIAISHLN